MWKRISNWLQTLQEKEQQDTPPEDILKRAVLEINLAIEKNEQLLAHLTQNQQHLQAQIQKAEFEQRRIESELQAAIRQQQKWKAQELLLQKQTQNQQKQDFELLYRSLLETIAQITAQVRNLNKQKEEIATKEVVFTAQIQSLQTQSDLQKYLQNLDVAHSFDQFEAQVVRAQVELELSDNILSVSAELQRLEHQEQNLDALLEEEMQKRAAQTQAQQEKRVHLLLGSNTENTQNKQKLVAEKEKLLAQFKAQNSPKPSENENQTQKKQTEKETLLQNFFQENAPPPPEKKDLIADFFKETDPKKEPKTNPKDDLLRQFFKNDPTQE
ncbi:hypothetical protein [Hugenholtzia roseola]|uniref:hypothetical protein n=1 Tax=Hugenholtzia roseola TaxID=1002 RepID=UPI0012B67BE7|nr:hypothetical protein [Hugenholtzia roseola]